MLVVFVYLSEDINDIKAIYLRIWLINDKIVNKNNCE